MDGIFSRYVIVRMIEATIFCVPLRAIEGMVRVKCTW